MRRELLIVIALITFSADQVAAYDLSQHQWRHRLLFLIAPDNGDPDLAAQQRGIALRRDAILDRDMRVFQLLPDKGFVEDVELPRPAVTKLRSHLGANPEDRLLILVGKDGGVKRRAALNADLRGVFLQIDAMPMRRDEVRTKREAGMNITPP